MFLLRYLKGIPEMGVVFSAQPGSLALVGHSDSNFTTPSSAGKSVSGYVFSLGSGVVSYRSKLQSTVAKSTAEAEYVALGLATAEALYLCLKSSAMRQLVLLSSARTTRLASRSLQRRSHPS